MVLLSCDHPHHPLPAPPLPRMDDAEACFILSNRFEVDRVAAVSAPYAAPGAVGEGCCPGHKGLMMALGRGVYFMQYGSTWSHHVAPGIVQTPQAGIREHKTL